MSERTKYDFLVEEIKDDRNTVVNALASSMSGMDTDAFHEHVRRIAMMQIAITAVEEVAQEERDKERAFLANPNRGCDVNGKPLDPNHPWNRERTKE